MFWKRSKTGEIPEQRSSDPLETFDRAVQNVMWARETLDQMFGCMAFHRGDGHDCDSMCVPWELQSYIATLPADGVRLLLVTMIKDFVHVVETDDHDEEIL